MKKFITVSLLVACLNLQAESLCNTKMRLSENSLYNIYMAVNEGDLEILDAEIPVFMQLSKEASKVCPDNMKADIIRIRTDVRNEYIKIQKLEGEMR